MNGSSFAPARTLVSHHHWLAYWKLLGVITILLVLSLGGFAFSTPFGPILLVSALIGVVGLYSHWSWHTLTFTTDGRLVRRRGVLGLTQDIITLFGVVTPYQIPILGPLLNVGSVFVDIPGSDSQIRHIANFRAFRTQLLNGTQQQVSRPELAVQVVIQLPPSQHTWVGYPPDRLPSEARDLIPAPPTGVRTDYGYERPRTSRGPNGRQR